MNLHAWAFVIGMGFFLWGFLALGASGKFPLPLEILFGVLAVSAGLVAGVSARNTWINDLVGWIVSLHPVASLIFMFASLLAVCATPFVLWWNAKKWTPLLAVAWVFLPSVLERGVITGEVGAQIRKVVMSIAGELTRQTAGWF